MGTTQAQTRAPLSHAAPYSDKTLAPSKAWTPGRFYEPTLYSKRQIWCRGYGAGSKTCKGHCKHPRSSRSARHGNSTHVHCIWTGKKLQLRHVASTHVRLVKKWKNIRRAKGPVYWLHKPLYSQHREFSWFVLLFLVTCQIFFQSGLFNLPKADLSHKT